MSEESKNQRAEEVCGRRVPEGETVLPFDFPCELGYECPVCRKEWDEDLQWSEYRSFLWCATCNFDYPTPLCVPLGRAKDSDYMNLGRDDAVKVYLDCIEDAVRRAREETIR